jgi:hypothetical protein
MGLDIFSEEGLKLVSDCANNQNQLLGESKLRVETKLRFIQARGLLGCANRGIYRRGNGEVSVDD